MSRFNLSSWTLANRSLVLFLMLVSLVAGLMAYQKLGRLEDPNFNIPAMTAVVIWPGATPDEVQNHVLNRMEQALQELPELRHVTSFARQGYGGISVVIGGRHTGAELNELWYQARKKIGDIRSALPADIRGPFYNDEYTDVYATLYALAAPDLTAAEQREFAETIKRRLQAVPHVNKVNILGQQPEQLHIEISTRKLASLGLSPQLLAQAISQHSAVRASGFIETRQDRVFVRLDEPLKTRADWADLPLSLGGRVLRLGDVATVRQGVEEPAANTVRFQGKPVLAIGVTPAPNANLLTLGRDLNKTLADIQAQLPVGVELTPYADQPTIAKESVWEFQKVFLEALVIVLGVTFLFLGWRTGVVVAASVPLVLGIVAVIMVVFGWNLDRITLGALIIALGLLVDDAIIAVEMMVLKMEEGWDKARAAVYAYTSTAFPMLTGTLVTMAGFMPVGFARSTSGEYAGGIFWIVGIALIVSWIVAVLFIPTLGMMLLPEKLAAHAHDPHDKPIYHRLRRAVDWAVDHRRTVLFGTLGLLVAAILGMKLVQQQFFPTASRPELLIELRLKAGSSLRATEAAVQQLEAVLAQDEDILDFVAYSGQGSPRFYISLQPELPNPSYAQFVLRTRDIEARENVRTRLMALFAEGRLLPDVRGRVLRLEFGPSVGFPVQFRITGPDLNQVRDIAAAVKTVVERSPLVRDTQYDWNEQVRVLRLNIQQDKARRLGISNQHIADQLQISLQGIPVAQIRRGEQLVDVILRGESSERLSLDRVPDIQLINPEGRAIPLSALATVEPAWEDPVVWRRNRNVIMTVRSDLADGVQGPYATQQLMPQLQSILDTLPAGYHIEAGGAIEESLLANQAIGAVFPVMILTMLTLLMIQLRSFARMSLVFLTFPLGIIGVVPALILFQAPFGFVALLGVIALGGMIMRNSVILVDQIDQDIHRGLPVWTAIVEATVRRARPVVLTAAAAILAMIPLSRSIFWGPMALSIMGGLVVATGLTLLVVPALYAQWFSVKRPAT